MEDKLLFILLKNLYLICTIFKKLNGTPNEILAILLASKEIPDLPIIYINWIYIIIHSNHSAG